MKKLIAIISFVFIVGHFNTAYSQSSNERGGRSERGGIKEMGEFNPNVANHEECVYTLDRPDRHISKSFFLLSQEDAATGGTGAVGGL